MNDTNLLSELRCIICAKAKEIIHLKFINYLPDESFACQEFESGDGGGEGGKQA